MKFFLLFCTILLFLTDLPAQPVRRYWIFLRDKGPVTGDIAPAVSEFTLTKRQRKNIPSDDFTDLPVFSGYTAILQQTGIRIRHRSRWFNAVSADLSGIPADKIRELPFVRDIQAVGVFRSSCGIRPAPAMLFKPSDDIYGPSGNQARMIGIPELHDQGFYGQGVRIALFDTGFRLDHEALQHISVVAAYDFINNDGVVDNQSEDSPTQYEHGTSVLSVIGGYSPGNLIGPAWKSEYLLAKTENIASETHIEEDNWVAAAEWADSLGADIISSSLGYSTFDKGEGNYTYEDMDGKTTIITRAANMAVEKGIAVFNSAGNEGSLSWHYITAPADGFDVIAVGGLNADGSLWNGSSRGPTYDGRIKPEVVAQASSAYIVNPATTDGYETATGTSLSCPLAAGSGAIILSINPNLTPHALRDLLIRSATHYLIPDDDTGYGTIDLVTALNLMTAQPQVQITEFKVTPAEGRNLISWTAHIEIGNNLWSLQRRTDNTPASVIAQIEGKIYSLQEKKYEILDNDISGGEHLEYILSAQTEYFGSADVDSASVEVPEPVRFELLNCYPNPFNSGTTITIGLNKPVRLTIRIYDTIGRCVRTLAHDVALSSGFYHYEWQGENDQGNLCSSGIYYIMAGQGDEQHSRKALLLK